MLMKTGWKARLMEGLGSSPRVTLNPLRGHVPMLCTHLLGKVKGNWHFVKVTVSFFINVWIHSGWKEKSMEMLDFFLQALWLLRLTYHQRKIGLKMNSFLLWTHLLNPETTAMQSFLMLNGSQEWKERQCFILLHCIQEILSWIREMLWPFLTLTMITG